MDTNTVVVTIVVALLGSSALNTLVASIVSRLIEKRHNREGFQESLRVLMKDRLRFLCIQYIEKGWVHEDELEDIMKMHKCYHDELKGNGFLDELMEKVKDLEVRRNGVI